MKKKRILGAAGAVAFATVGAVAFATPAQALTCYDTELLTVQVWNEETYTETAPAVPEVPAVPGTPEAFNPVGDYADTRATGHYAGSNLGLHIWTEGNTSTDKVAGYLPVDIDLADALDAALHYDATVGIEPGAQLKVDIDGDGVFDGILVGESVYGDNWWLTGGSSDAFKAFDPSGEENGGNGSEWFGTLAQWVEEIPLAHVTAVGFSLGSGVLGDGTVTGFTVGGNELSFVQHVSAVPEVPAVPAVPATYAWVVTTEGLWDVDAPDTTTPEVPVVGDTRNVLTGTDEVEFEVETECPAVPGDGGSGSEAGGTPAGSITPATPPVRASLAATGSDDMSPMLPIGAASAVLLGIGAVTAEALRRKHSTN